MAIIIHKIEGRTFLLGRNGYYNKLYEILPSVVKTRFFFILIFKQATKEEMANYIEDLVQKGDQHELKQFKKEGKIICVNEETLDVDMKQYEDSLFKWTFHSYLINIDYEIEERNSESDIPSYSMTAKKLIASTRKYKPKCAML